MSEKRNSTLREAVLAAVISSLIAGAFALGQSSCTQNRFERTGPAVGTAGFWKAANLEASKMKEKRPKLDYWELEQSSRTQNQRWYTRRVEFGVTFEDIPAVHVALSGFDIGTSGGQPRGNDRIQVFVQQGSVDTTGCEVVIATWADTELHYAELRFFAYGTKK